jgi:uroporphyrinogen III methyltransferase/synthase
MKAGRVYLVGAGPGDPGLITVRGLKLLQQAGSIVYDHLASPALLRNVRADAELIYVGKQAGLHALSQDKINQLLIDRASAGLDVVRLKGGDPFVFGRGGEEALALVQAGIAFEVVPGVTASIAAAAYAGIAVTHRGLASCFGIATGHETPDKDEPVLDFPALSAWGGTLAFYMGVANLDYICAKLIQAGTPANTPAAIISWGTTSRQKVVSATLADLPAHARAQRIAPPAVIIVGAVVALREKLNWFEARPLVGRQIVVTRSRQQASQLTSALEDLGAEVIESPAIKILPVEDTAALRQSLSAIGAGKFDWIIFTSTNGVDAAFDQIGKIGLDARIFAGAKVAAIGPATAEALLSRGIRADAQGGQFTSLALVQAIARAEGTGDVSLAGRKILCLRSDIAPKDIIADLASRGAAVTDVVAYQTQACTANIAELAEQIRRGEIHWITFTSSSTVENFAKNLAACQLAESLPALLGKVRLASIGPTTSAALRKLSLTVAAEAKTFTIPGLVQAILEFESEPKDASSGDQGNVG